MKRHPLSALFSRYDLTGEDLQAMADDIKANGQFSPITLLDGQILDGWNRYQACRLAKTKPVTIKLAPGVDPWEFVKGSNMLRRHMSPAERVAVMLLKMQMIKSADDHMVNNDQPKESTNPTVREIQKDLEVSKGVAVKAAQVARANDPELNQALAEKRIGLDEASKISRLPEPERKAALESPKPAPAPKPSPATGCECEALRTRVAELEGQNSELVALMTGLQEELEAASRVLDAEDLLTQFNKEIKRAQEQARIVQSRNNGLMNENSDLKGRLKSALRKIERLKKDLAGRAA